MVTNQSKPTNRPNGDEMFINPFTDYGFKRIFGTEISKDLLIEFLNSLIPEANIEDLAFCNVEQIAHTEESRRAFFDILCRNSNNEYILVEMQRKSQEHFQDRILFYTSFLIQNQMSTVQRAYRKIRKEMKQGLVDPGGYPDWSTDWLYHMKHIYVVCFLGYTMFKEYPETYRWDVLRMDKKHHVIFGDALQEIYLEMPKFRLPLSQCDTLEKRFLYVLNNMEVLDRLPKELNNQLFQRMKEIASLSNLSADQMIAYHRSMMEDYAYYDTINTTFKKGEAKGRREGREEGIAEGIAKGRAENAIEMARKFKEDGIDPAIIAKNSGLSIEEIEAL